ncbi:MAG: hypothetical protein H6923_10735 [Alphaproteobacteria bacterium]|nr:hypothetical protein [Alphaproteobacteria bacterium]
MTGLTGKPWSAPGVVPEEVRFPRGMLGLEERQMLFYLTRVAYRGEGYVVDAGAYAGASAYCLAAGLARSPHSEARFARVHSYDLFRALDQYVADAITKDFKPIGIGGDYFDVFEFQTGHYRERIHAHPGDFLEHAPPDGPIEILFIDVAKTQTLNSHLVRNFLPRLIPGRSLIVQQDYYHAWHPFTQVTMEILRDHVEVLDPLIANQSRLYRLTSAPPPDLIAEIAEYAYPAEKLLATLDSAIERDAGLTRAMLEVTKLWQLVLLNRFDDSNNLIARLRARPDFDGKQLWCRQTEQIAENVSARLKKPQLAAS